MYYLQIASVGEVRETAAIEVEEVFGFIMRPALAHRVAGGCVRVRCHDEDNATGAKQGFRFVKGLAGDANVFEEV